MFLMGDFHLVTNNIMSSNPLVNCRIVTITKLFNALIQKMTFSFKLGEYFYQYFVAFDKPSGQYFKKDR